MATSKTLAPTNVTISIPAMTDTPDASVFSNCVDKEADAINTLNSQLGKMTVHGVATASGGSCTITAIKNGEYIVFFYAGHMTSLFLAGTSTQVFFGGDDPADYGFTFTRNDKVYTITRTNGNDFQYAWLEITN